MVFCGPGKMHKATNKPETAAKYLLIAISLYYIIVLFYLIAKRIAYPFELEWLEGDMLLTAIRVMEGKAIYAAPGYEYVSGIYPPVYYFAVASFFKVFEPGFFVIRSVSVLGLIGVLSIVFAVINRETSVRWLGIAGLGFFSAFYAFHASWYDIARLDSFFYLLLLSAIFVASMVNRNPWAVVVSSILFCLAIYTKQSALVFSPFAFLYIFMHDKRQSFVFAGILAVSCLIVFILLQLSSEGRFIDFTLLRPLSFPNEPGYLYKYIQDVIAGFPVLAALTLGFVLVVVSDYKKTKIITIWEIMLIPAVMTYIRIRPVVGAYLNDSIYLTLWFSILVPIWLNRYVIEGKIKKLKYLGTVILALIIFQLSLLWFAPGKWVPSSGSVAKGNSVIQRLREAEGPVFVHLHPVYAWLAEKETHFNSVNLWAYNLPAKLEARPQFEVTELYEKISGQYFSVIVLDNQSDWYGEKIVELVRRHYRLESRISYDTDKEFMTLTGFETRPETIWVPK